MMFLSSLVLKVDLLSRIHHKNLVSLIGFSQEKDKQMLIYEYFPNGCLRDHLYGRSPLSTFLSHFLPSLAPNISQR